jgi:NAD-dependent SIR2 family protein deacetylase
VLEALGQYGAVFRNPNGTNFQADLYNYFAALVSGFLDYPDTRPNRKDTIITFNYDLVLDHALLRLGIRPNYHIDPHLLWVDEEPPAGKTIDLLKLHGSTNWGICASCNKKVMVLSQKMTNDPWNFRTLNCPACKSNAFQLLLIPPSWDKSEYQDIVKRIWKQALEELKLATRICIVGYSMPENDAFFQYLLTLALSQNDGLYKLVVVDKVQNNPIVTSQQGRAGEAVSQIEEKYRKLLDSMFQDRRFSFHADGVQGFLGNNRSLGELGRGEVIGRGNITYS